MPDMASRPVERSMTAVEAPDIVAIRNVALVGASATGKTTLAEALLASAGAIKTPGTVEKGSTTCDYDPQERPVQHSLNTAITYLEHEGARVHLLDTPGA